MSKIVKLLWFMWILLALCGGLIFYTAWFPQTQTGQEITISPESGETFTIDIQSNIKGTSGEKIVFTNQNTGEIHDAYKPFIPGTYTVDSSLNPGTWNVEGGKKAVLVITAENTVTVTTTTSPRTKNVDNYLLVMIFIIMPLLIGFIWLIDKHILKRS